MNIAYIGHGYHEKTKSTGFMLEFIRKNSRNVDVFADHSLVGGEGIDKQKVIDGNYDLIVVFQMEKIAKWFARRLPERLVFVPMYDGARNLGSEFWLQFKNSRVLNFSHTLHERLQKIGVPSLSVQYFPDPAAFARVEFSDLHGFLWQRRPEIAWPLIKRLVGGTKLEGLTLHLALDPGAGEPCVPSVEETEAFNVALSYWQEDRAAFEHVMASSNIYFAPRLFEGIGMSFLEAMARGQCVIAPDAPTMSEYITHGVSGLLYDINNPHALDFSNAAKIGATARRKVENGYIKWNNDQNELFHEFFFHGREVAYKLLERISFKSRNEHGCDNIQRTNFRFNTEVGSRRKRRNVTDVPGTPLVTVAMVTRNVRDTFEATFESILAQTYENFEVVIVDGCSQDGTQELFEKRADEIAQWVSEPDKGPFDGMNKAARLARGRYIIFMNAGDLFASEKSLAVAMEGISETNEPDFIIGHHFYVTQDGVEEFHKANDVDQTWLALRGGNFSWKWLSGMPCHQSTLTRTALLLDHGGYNLSWQIAADHEFMYRMKSKGARFHHCDETVAIYFGGGFSAQNESLCHDEWRQLLCTYGDKNNVDSMFVKAKPVPSVEGKSVSQAPKKRGFWNKFPRELRRVIRQIASVAA